jgi:hypothetical protein
VAVSLRCTRVPFRKVCHGGHWSILDGRHHAGVSGLMIISLYRVTSVAVSHGQPSFFQQLPMSIR